MMGTNIIATLKSSIIVAINVEEMQMAQNIKRGLSWNLLTILMAMTWKILFSFNISTIQNKQKRNTTTSQSTANIMPLVCSSDTSINKKVEIPMMKTKSNTYVR